MTKPTGRHGAVDGDGWRPTARAALGRTVTAGREAYRRETALPRLLPPIPPEIAADAGAGRWIVARLARALRAERTRGRAGHWSYDLNRHIALHQAYEAERSQLVDRRSRDPRDGERDIRPLRRR